jgi:hypothetical protein
MKQICAPGGIRFAKVAFEVLGLDGESKLRSLPGGWFECWRLENLVILVSIVRIRRSSSRKGKIGHLILEAKPRLHIFGSTGFRGYRLGRIQLSAAPDTLLTSRFMAAESKN